MFADSMLETSWTQRSRRGWTTLSSFGVQALVMGLLMMLPLIRPEGLPLLHRLSTPVSLGRPMGDPMPVRVAAATGPGVRFSNLLNHRLMLPDRVPIGVTQISDDSGSTIGDGSPYVPGVMGSGAPDGILNPGTEGTRPVMQPPPAIVSRPVRVSNMNEGNLLQRFQPTYPPIAISARIQGQVLMSAVISKEGTIENLRVLAGHPMLVRAAVEAVRHWRYRPYVLNGEPVEVETQITVNFSLTGN